jgi:hypothetical protein
MHRRVSRLNGPTLEGRDERGYRGARGGPDAPAAGRSGIKLRDDHVTMVEPGIRMAPRAAILLDAATAVTAAALAQLKRKAESGVPLDANDLKSLRMAVQSSCELSREERALIRESMADDMSSEEIEAVIREAAEKGLL